MQKMLLAPAFGALAFGALALPARAQPADQNSAKIVLFYTGEVLPGQTDAFKAVAQKVIATVAQEPGTLMYEWALRPDGKTFDSVELYQNSAAVVAHVKEVGSKFGKELGQVQKEQSLAVFGSPDEQAKSTLAPLNPVYETHVAGFIR